MEVSAALLPSYHRLLLHPVHGRSFPARHRHRHCPNRPSSPRTLLSISASSSTADPGFLHGPFLEGELDRPLWTGNEPLSRFVDALISIKPLFDLMRAGARQLFIRSAEKKGVPWKKMAEQVLTSNVYAEKDAIENPSISYPEYYLQNFHGYVEGNLSWQAAAEMEAATASMVIRCCPTARSVEEAIEVVRGNWLKAIEDHHHKCSGGLEISDILDIGCSTGIGTRYLADRFPSAQVTGLDLSPYFLAVAVHKEKQMADGGQKRKSIRWLHAKGEETGLPSASFDIVSFTYVIHECPQTASVALLKEAFRLLRPGGTVVLTDSSPKSKVVQDLPPVTFTLMKATEPFLDEFYAFNLEQAMEEVGFKNVKSILTDRRHRTTTGTAPV